MNFKDQIDNYVLGKLSASEAEVFQQQLSTDTELAKEVKKREIILSGLEALGNQKMRDRIKSVRKEMLAEEKNSLPQIGRSRTLIKWISAAAAIFLIGFFGWQFLNPTALNADELFAKSYQPYIENFGSRGNDTTKDYLQAGAYYDAKNYSAAIPLLQNILKLEPQNSEVELILGDCFLSSDKLDEAIFHFNAVLERKTNLYNDPAQWFLALSFLKQNKIEDCKNVLKNLIENSKADYHQEAKELFSKLK